MMDRHYPFWPKRVPKTLTVPKTTLFDNLKVSAQRYPDKTAIVYYGRSISYRDLLNEVNALAGFLQREWSVSAGDRILLDLQNSPQFVIAFYAILRANAVVVPINPMNLTEELAFYIEDAQAEVAIVGQELYDRIAPLKQGQTGLKHVLVAAYSDYVSPDMEYECPDMVTAPRQHIREEGVVLWQDALQHGSQPGPLTADSDDMAVLPYTSGTTGRPKGCIHTHATVQANAVGASVWANMTADAVVLGTLPFFHVTGMQHSMNAPIYAGSTMVIMSRWDRDVAGKLIQEYGCTHWTNISTMVVDFLSNPNLSKYKLDTLNTINGGGAPLPEAVGQKLYEMTGLYYAEGYGLTETMAQTHFNPPDRPKLQCMGIPSFDVDARIVDPETLKELGPGEEGEVIVSGPQVLKGYWNRPKENQESFVTIEGKSFFRTGDIAKYDEEGYFFMVDRIKRMINASGYKVWPTEVESILYKHPAVQQACVIGVPDPRRGETVKAFIILNEKDQGKVTEQDIIEWSKGKMAAYKYPRIVEFVESLPLSGSGKILWRKLQEEELKKRRGH
ncbi:long-chain fatty acid--CoA ligase [Thermoflavimicrobium dichotomicum]|uniref:Fatty-acyl-CoA synthase n=1 Tax=Thermoflavimicrobium dichotomicum TaxID=46223 RepID=A0A1I3PWZ4_9BACL|nr:long-chain fatty acid--CoA ligase [Thermoflavimicrobium dichotomicum]SFJ25960.1 fatty-acyl-CoA synthase [Thermoflavimicrobium dichotomicum]